MTNKTSLRFVKITKYNKEGNITSSNYVDAFENSYKGNADSNPTINNLTKAINRTRGSTSLWGKVIVKTCPLCLIRYTARESASERCYSCQYHINRISKQQAFKGFPINNRYNEIDTYLKTHPEILKQPIGGWHKERHIDSLKELEVMDNAE